MPETFWKEFEFLIKILGDLKFIEKQVNDKVKLILGEILNIWKIFEDEESGSKGHVEFIHISPRIMRVEESTKIKMCKRYA